MSKSCCVSLPAERYYTFLILWAIFISNRVREFEWALQKSGYPSVIPFFEILDAVLKFCLKTLSISFFNAHVLRKSRPFCRNSMWFVKLSLPLLTVLFVTLWQQFDAEGLQCFSPLHRSIMYTCVGFPTMGDQLVCFLSSHVLCIFLN